MKGIHHFAAAAFCALSLHAGALRAEENRTYDTGMIPSDHIMLPDGAPGATVFLISDADGWNDRDQKIADTLVAKGAAVVGINFTTYLPTLEADKGDCVYMISDIEELTHQIQRAGGATRYSPPVLAGIGEGGALALAMISQSPVSTIGEAVAANPQAGIPLGRILCTPAQKTHAGTRTIYGFVDGALPAPVTVLLDATAPADGRAHAEALQQAHSDVDIRTVTGNAADELEQFLSDRIDEAGSGDTPSGLPLTILDAAPAHDTMAVIYSGDGGWRDIDSEAGSALQEKGVPVVGVDSLHYFWSERKPQETADDLARIIDTYTRQWNVHHVLLVGYSFGADVLPATYNLLPEKIRKKVRQITLISLSQQVDYEISVTGWLGVAGDGKAGNPVNDIARINPALVQCIYGTDEDDDPCPSLKASGVETVPVEGGHHLDGDYSALAGRILDSMLRRAAQDSNPAK